MFFIYDTIEGFQTFEDEEEALKEFEKISNEIKEVKEHWETGEVCLCFGKVNKKMEMISCPNEKNEQEATFLIKKY